MLRTSHRMSELQNYERLGMECFPYDHTDRPWRGFLNPGMLDGYDDLLHHVSTFGVLLGDEYVVVDVDQDRGGNLADLEAVFGFLPPTMTVTTPSGPGNVHLYFCSAVPLRTAKTLSGRFPGIDFLGLNVKGATSVRNRGTEAEVAYVRQRPYLDPAPLPAALEAEWSVQAPEGSFLEVTPSGVQLNDTERAFVLRTIAASLEAIKGQEDGGRHVVLYREASKIYQNAALLGHVPGTYDQAIRDAYLASGGQDFRDLDDQIRHTKRWAAEHPRHRPAISPYVHAQNAAIAEWADIAASMTGSRQNTLRGLIKAIALEASPGLNLTTAGKVLAQRHSDVGNQSAVSKNLTWLQERGFLSRDGEIAVPDGKSIPTFGLTVSQL